MIFSATDTNWSPLPSRLHWNSPAAAAVSGAELWSRISRRLIDDLRDEGGHRFLLRDELWVTAFPPRGGGLWRVEADSFGRVVVGRGAGPEEAVQDWRKRFRMTLQRFLEMRPFEMTAEDKELWVRMQTVVDIPRYKATKPITVRQLGKVVKARTGVTVVQWEDGTREKVNPAVFDEAFARYRVGQPFEAVVTRHPLTFRLIRADAVRRLPGNVPALEDRSKAIWERAVGSPDTEGTEKKADEIDEEFWLTPSE